MNEQAKIPKKIHQVHLGGKPLSDKEKKWRDSWVKHNPEWEYILWDDELVSSQLSITHEDIYNKCKSYSEKSDVLRFEILYQFGGLYIDTDFECLKPIDPLFKNKELVIFTQINDPKDTQTPLCGAFLGATQRNSDIKKLIDGLPERQKLHGHKIASVKFGPVYLSHTLGYEKGTPDGHKCKQKTVYPYMWWEKNRRNEDFSKTHPEAYAVHHWDGSWTK